MNQTQTVFLELTSSMACQTFSLIIIVKCNDCFKCHGSKTKIRFGHQHFLSNFSLTDKHYAGGEGRYKDESYMVSTLGISQSSREQYNV